ncbi:MAG TPA: hypothetical protein VLA97_08145 [Nocardioidaceae bacterium]|nr:hypothetical protein [Nocardioidaceae bacterium]
MTENEVERLRARIAELESQLATAPQPAQPSRAREAGRWRSVTAAVLIVLACVLAPLSVTAVWASTQVSDTERYVETVAPLADNPDVQRAIANEVTDAVLEYVDVEALTTQALDALAQQPNVPPRVSDALPALAGPITNGVESFTREEVGKIIASPQFATVWAEVNRVAHEQVVTLLEGEQGGVLSAQEGTVTLNLGPIIEQVKDRLVAAGFTLAENVPTVDRSFVLVSSDAITQVQGAYRLLSALGTWLPFITLALFVAGVLVARDRRATLFRGALGVTGSMVVLGVGLAVGRVLYLDALPGVVLSREAAGEVFDTLIRFLRTGLRYVAVLFLVVAVAAFFTGPSEGAVKTRSALTSGIGALGGRAEAAGWKPGRVGTWTAAHTRALRIGVVVAAGLVLAFWERPTAPVVLWTAVFVLVALAVVQFLARPATAAATAGTTPGATAGATTERPVPGAAEGAEPALPRQAAVGTPPYPESQPVPAATAPPDPSQEQDRHA